MMMALEKEFRRATSRKKNTLFQDAPPILESATGANRPLVTAAGRSKHDNLLKFQREAALEEGLGELLRMDSANERALLWADLFGWGLPDKQTIRQFKSLSDATRSSREMNCILEAVELVVSEKNRKKEEGGKTKRLRRQLARVLCAVTKLETNSDNHVPLDVLELAKIGRLACVVLEVFSGSETNAFGFVAGLRSKVLFQIDTLVVQAAGLLEEKYPELFSLCADLGISCEEIVAQWCSSLFVDSGLRKPSLLACFDVFLFAGRYGLATLVVGLFASVAEELRQLVDEHDSAGLSVVMERLRGAFKMTSASDVYQAGLDALAFPVSMDLLPELARLQREQFGVNETKRPQSARAAPKKQETHKALDARCLTARYASPDSYREYIAEWENLHKSEEEEALGLAHNWLQVFPHDGSDPFYLFINGETWQWEVPSCGFISSQGVLCLPQKNQ